MRLAALFLLMSLLTGPLWAGPVISWFDLYPIHFYPENDNDDIPRSGAGFITYPASCNWFVREKEDSFNYDFLDAQIRQLEKLGLKGSIICEVNPLYYSAAPWLSVKCAEAEETVRDQNGSVSGQPSIASPIFNREQRLLAEAWMAHLDREDRQRRIEYVHPGAEWWFNVYERYGLPDIAAFRDWLKAKYTTTERLNRAWQSGFEGFDRVTPPVAVLSGNGVSDLKDYSLSADAAYGDCKAGFIYGPLLGGPDNAPQLIAVEGGKRYTISFDVRTERLKGAVYCEAEFSDSDNTAFVIFKGLPFVRDYDSDWRRVSGEMTAPASAGYMNIQLGLLGSGTARFRNVSVTDEAGRELAKPLREWNDVSWSGSGQEFLREEDVSSVVNAPGEPPYRNDDTAVYDWTCFWYEYAAGWINNTHRLFKDNAHGRKTVSYLTNAFAWGVEWDSVAATAISLDRVLMDSDAIDETGLQVCSCDGDDYRITCALDTARKYNKPLWAVDLVDFTSGVHTGEWNINKMAQNAVASGAHGLVYCGWDLKHLTDDYSYKNHLPVETLEEINRKAAAGIKALEGKKAPRECALIYTNLPASSNDTGGYKNSPFSFMGWYKILKACLVNVDIISLYELEKKPGILKGYKFVLVPHCPYITKGAREALRRYSGTVYYGGPFGLFSETGEALAPSVREDGEDLGAEYCGVLERGTHAGNTPPLFLWGEETPRRSELLSRGIDTLRNAIKKAGIRLPFETDDPYLNATRWQNGRETVYYFVNQRKTGGFNLSMPYYSQVSVIKDGQEEAVSNNGDRIDIGSFDTSCIIRIVK